MASSKIKGGKSDKAVTTSKSLEPELVAEAPSSKKTAVQSKRVTEDSAEGMPVAGAQLASSTQKTAKKTAARLAAVDEKVEKVAKQDATKTVKEKNETGAKPVVSRVASAVAKVAQAAKTATDPIAKKVVPKQAAASPAPAISKTSETGAKLVTGTSAKSERDEELNKPIAKPEISEVTPPAPAQSADIKPTPSKSAAAKAAAVHKSVSSDQQIVFDPTADRSSVAEQAIDNPTILTALIENLSTEARRVRQFSAAALKVISESSPELLVAHILPIADALHRPEAQTRWECLDVLTSVVAFDPDACDEAVVGAEGSLYDEESGTARLAAVRFLCAFGSLDAKRSIRVWPLLDEAIQCYHGDPEFQDMLVSVISFAGGRISKEVRGSLASRMEFDAANGKGALQRRATQIVELCKKK